MRKLHQASANASKKQKFKKKKWRKKEDFMSQVVRVYLGMPKISRNFVRSSILIMVKKLSLEDLSIEKASSILIILPTNMSLSFRLASIAYLRKFSNGLSKSLASIQLRRFVNGPNNS